MAASSKHGGFTSRGQPGLLDQNLPQEYQHRVMKKIAQLTKVIYQLNVQNEEHNKFMQHLKSIHEQEVGKLLTDHHERLKREQDGNSRELKKLREHVSASNDELSAIREENTLLKEDGEKMKQQHLKNIESLRLKYDANLEDFREDISATRRNLAEEKTKVAALKNWCDAALSENVQKVQEQYERELQEMKEAVQRDREHCAAEMEALHVAHQSKVHELLEAQRRDLLAQYSERAQCQDQRLARVTQEWQDKQKALECSHLAVVQQLNGKISSLSCSLREAEDRYTTAEESLRGFERMEEEKRHTLTDVESRLERLVKEKDGLCRQVNDLHLELDLSREKYQQQTQELTNLSATQARLEAAHADDKAKIKALREVEATLKNHVADLEKERSALLSSLESSSTEYSGRVRALKEELERTAKEKEELCLQYAREIEGAQTQLSVREQEMAEERHRALKETQWQLEQEMGRLKAAHKDELDHVVAELSAKRVSDIDSLAGQHAAQVRALDEELATRAVALSEREGEVKRLKSILEDSREGLGSASKQITDLETELSAVKKELAQNRGLLGRRDTECEALKSDLARLEYELKQLRESSAEQLRNQKGSLTASLEEVWSTRMREECAALRLELTARHKEETQATRAELVSRKEEEVQEERHKWQTEVERLKEMVTSLEARLKTMRKQAATDVEAKEREGRRAAATLEEELASERAQHAAAIEELQNKYQLKEASLREEGTAALRSLEEQLQGKHRAEVHTIREADRIAADALRDKLERDKAAALHKAGERHREDLECLRQEMNEAQLKEVTQLRLDHEQSMEGLRVKLGKELAQREAELVNQTSATDTLSSKLKEEVALKEKLSREGGILRGEVQGLRKELARKVEEVQAIRKDATNKIRHREQQLVAAHKVELDDVAAQHRQQLSDYLGEFNRAKEMLVGEIKDLRNQLELAEVRYSQRESRPEDLDAIRELKKLVSQQEFMLKEAVADKRVYQMELVNREQNYNKLFSANPMVGVLDPLAHKDKKKKLPQGGTYLGSRHSSAPSLASPGLDPTLQHSREVGPGKVSVNDSPLLHHKRSSAKNTALPVLSSFSSKI